MREALDISRETETEIPVTLSIIKDKPVFKDTALLTKQITTLNAEKTKAIETIEGLQSKIRELEKKAQLQNVLHEELALEMAAIKCTAAAAGRGITGAGGGGVGGRLTNTSQPTPWHPDSDPPFSPDSILSLPSSSSGLVSTGDAGGVSGVGVGVRLPPPLLSKPPPCDVPSCYPSSLAAAHCLPALPTLPISMSTGPNMKAVDGGYGSLMLGNALDTTGLHSHHHHQPRVMPQIPSGIAPHFDITSGLNSLHTTTNHDEVDMLDIPGKGRCYVYIAKYFYDPLSQSPNDFPESELPVNAGDYLLVWGGVDEDGFLDGELLDGRRGLVPSNFVHKLTGDDLLEFHQSVVQGLRDCDESGTTNIPQDLHYQYLQPGEYNQLLAAEHDYCSFFDEGDEDLSIHGDPPVAAPKQLTLERQLNKSALIGWNHPDTNNPPIDCYHVYVDGVLKVTVKATERPRALVEGVDSNRPHRISVRSVTANRRTSRDAACTMLIGKDVPLGPTSVKASRVTASSAVISWMPSNSNYQHQVCVNNVELRTVKPGIYRHTITGLGVPEPPSEVQVEPGPQDGTLLVTWHPVLVSVDADTTVTGYAVYADGKKVTDVDTPSGDHALIDINKLLSLNPKQITVRTKAHDSQSSDSVPSQIPISILKGRHGLEHKMEDKHMRHGYGKNQQRVGQVVIETEENLSDKEIYPPNLISIPAIEITKDSGNDLTMSEEETMDRHHMGRGLRMRGPRGMSSSDHHQYHSRDQYQGVDPGRGLRDWGAMREPVARDKQIRWFVALFDYDPTTMSPNPDACDEELPFLEGDTIKVYGDKDTDGFYWGECKGHRGFVPHNMVVEVQAPEGGSNYHNDSRRGGPGERWGDIYANMTVKRMIALYDYNPEELSPNADAEVELSFKTGDVIYIYGDMDDDGFYIGELNGVRGLVPSNFLTGAPTKHDGGTSEGPAGLRLGKGAKSLILPNRTKMPALHSNR